MIRTDEALESGSFFVSFSVTSGEPFPVATLNETFPVWLIAGSVARRRARSAFLLVAGWFGLVLGQYGLIQFLKPVHHNLDLSIL